MVYTVKYLIGDIWQLSEQLDAWVVVTTNTVIRNDGRAVMGAGIAKEAAKRFPDLPFSLANHIRRWQDRVYIYQFPVICLPTKRNWRNPSRLDWIEKGCHDLKEVCRIIESVGDNRPVLVPPLGCGHGGLNWERQVRPVVDSILDNERFLMVNK